MTLYYSNISCQVLAERLKLEFEFKHQALTSLLDQVKQLLSKIDHRCSSTDKENTCGLCGDNLQVVIDEIMSFRHKLHKLTSDLRSVYGEDSCNNRCMKYLHDKMEQMQQSEDLQITVSLVTEIQILNEKNCKLKEEIENSTNTANRRVAKFQIMLSQSCMSQKSLEGEEESRKLIDSFVRQHVNLKRCPLKDKNK